MSKKMMCDSVTEKSFICSCHVYSNNSVSTFKHCRHFIRSSPRQTSSGYKHIHRALFESGNFICASVNSTFRIGDFKVDKGFSVLIFHLLKLLFLKFSLLFICQPCAFICILIIDDIDIDRDAS